MPRVLFVCVANSFRSQMAEALAQAAARPGWEIWSAGSAPGGGVHPLAIQLMDELKLDLRGRRSKGLEAVPAGPWDYVVTMGCGDACPAVAAHRRLDWDLPDPAALPLEEARRLRDDLKRRIEALLASHR